MFHQSILQALKLFGHQKFPSLRGNVMGVDPFWNPLGYNFCRVKTDPRLRTVHHWLLLYHQPCAKVRSRIELTINFYPPLFEVPSSPLFIFKNIIEVSDRKAIICRPGGRAVMIMEDTIGEYSLDILREIPLLKCLWDRRSAPPTLYPHNEQISLHR